MEDALSSAGRSLTRKGVRTLGTAKGLEGTWNPGTNLLSIQAPDSSALWVNGGGRPRVAHAGKGRGTVSFRGGGRGGAGSLLQPVGGASPEDGRGLSYKWAVLAPADGWAWCLLYLVARALGPPPLQDPHSRLSSGG